MIPLVDLTAQYHSIKEEIDAAVSATLESGHFILGPAVSTFEQNVAAYLGVEHAIGLASGTDALVPAQLVTVTGTDPMVASAGACTFTCVPLM